MRTEDSDFDRVLDSLKNYFPGDGKELCWEIIDWLESLPFYIERENFICVHAGIAVDAQNRVLLPDKTLPEEFVSQPIRSSARRLQMRDIRAYSRCLLVRRKPHTVLSSHARTVP